MKNIVKTIRLIFVFTLNSCNTTDDIITPPTNIENEEEPLVGACYKKVENFCDDLNLHPIMIYLSNHSCSGYDVMHYFLAVCPTKQFLSPNGPLPHEEYLYYYYSEIAGFVFDSTMSSMTLVHETSHLLAHELSISNNHDFYFINQENFSNVEITENFPSSELVSFIDSSNITLRFNSYINGGALQTTQTKGIYGLLGEFNAYYHGSLALKEFGVEDNQVDFTHITYASNAITPYYEFKYWILSYLILAKDSQVTIYNAIINNEEFKEAFLEIEELYRLLAEDLSVQVPFVIQNSPNLENLILQLNSQAYQEMMTNLQ